MASPIQWTWVWVNSGSWWRIGRPGVLWFMRSQRVEHDWATELNWIALQHRVGFCHSSTESAIGIYMSPPPWTSLPPPTPLHPSRLSQSTRFENPVLYWKFPLAIYFAYGNTFVSLWHSQFVPHFPFPTVSTSLFSVCVSNAALQTGSSVPFFSGFHIYALIYDICFSLSDLLQEVSHICLSSTL